MKTVLYATDCSKYDTDTLQYAYELCQHLKVDLVLLHVYSLPPIQFSTIRPRKHLSTHTRDEQLNLLKEYAKKHIKENSVKTKISFEVTENVSVSDGILSTLKQTSSDLLLVGMKDEHTKRGIFSGSIAKALLGKVNCPLLMIPSSKSFKSIKTIVYASDFEEDDISALQELVEIAQPFNAKIKIVHIATKEEYLGDQQMEWFKEMVRQKIKYQDIEFQVFFHDTVYEGLRIYIDSHRADLVVMLEREEHGLLKNLFHDDMVKTMESQISIPLLSLNKIGLKER